MAPSVNQRRSGKLHCLDRCDRRWLTILAPHVAGLLGSQPESFPLSPRHVPTRTIHFQNVSYPHRHDSIPVALPMHPMNLAQTTHLEEVVGLRRVLHVVPGRDQENP